MNPLDFFYQNGVCLFPIQPGTKEPAVPKGTSWKGYITPVKPPYGVDLASSLVVVDGDSSVSTAWIRAHCPPTPFRVLTGPHHDAMDAGRGVHFYYRAPDANLPRFLHRDTLIIECRSRDQYVVGPMSVHPSGCTYKPSDWSWQWTDLPVFPADFLFDDGSVIIGGSASGATYEVPDVMPRGHRRHELFRLIRSCKSHSDKATTRAFVLQAMANKCQPPMTLADFTPESFDAWFSRSWRQADRAGFNLPVIAYEDTLAVLDSTDDDVEVLS